MAVTEPRRQREVRMKVTLNDVSRIAHVSASTVSHVINKTRPVNEETRQRVMAAIEQTGYIPNLMAKSLKQSASYTIGLVVSDIRNEFFVDVIHTIDAEARKAGYQVFVSGSDENPEKEQEILRAFCERRVDGIIYSPTRDSESGSVSYLQKSQVPVVMIDRLVGDYFDWVGVENHDSTQKLVKYLADLGHRKIGFLAGFRGINTTEERIQGYLDAVEEYRLESNERWLITGDYRKDLVSEQVVQVMSSRNHPTAWIAANNRMVYNAMQAVKILGLKVPEDVALVSFGDFEWAEYFDPQITTMAQPCEMIGIQAFSLLKQRIDHPDVPVQRIRLKPKLIIRESCGEKKRDDR